MKNDLKYLLQPWINMITSHQITGITLDSRKVKPGNLFCALQGAKKHGDIFIEQAIKNGAIAILCETKQKYHGQITQTIHSIPIICFSKLSQNLFKILNRYYNIENKLTLIGITGTNGKSSVAHIIAQWNNLLNQKIGIMGTLGNGTYNDLEPSENTTESPIKIYNFFLKMLTKNIKIVAMEISSHGIAQNRILNLKFSIAILTNVTSDHLDYHKTIDNYVDTKWRFLSTYNIKTFIINADDSFGKIWIKKLSKHDIVVISIHPNFNYSSFKKWIYAYHIINKTYHTYIYFNSSWGSGILKSKLIGLFNVTNLLLSISTLLILGHPLSFLIQICKYINPIFGRMQTFKILNKPSVIVDYAHNVDAFKNVLQTVRTLYHHKIWCIFGCGGDRDKSKRSLMGKIAEQLADKIILTNDNPRNENSISIIEDIIKGCKYKKNIYIIENREQAINFAIKHAKPHDCIIILGKGHERYQIIKDKKYYFSDQKIIKKLIGKQI
ncbi:MAG: UDP-N-acetylmuramoyl-L-alanyl-D-glutamate--2,6-diaminopimelate ligase [Buchnera aphidicola (Schlechtendalia peitan)]